MIIFKVEWNAQSQSDYFGGSCHGTDFERYFTTEEKAKNFIEKEVTEPCPTWGEDKTFTIKKAGEGEIKKIEVE